MQKPTNIDYRNFFDFDICYPIFINQGDDTKHILLSFIEQGCVPTCIIRDKASEDFRLLKEERGEEAFNNAKAIVYIVQLRKEFLT